MFIHFKDYQEDLKIVHIIIYILRFQCVTLVHRTFIFAILSNEYLLLIVFFMKSFVSLQLFRFIYYVQTIN